MKQKQTIQRNNDSKYWLFETINEINRSLSQLTKRKNDMTQINEETL